MHVYFGGASSVGAAVTPIGTIVVGEAVGSEVSFGRATELGAEVSFGSATELGAGVVTFVVGDFVGSRV